MEYNAVIGIDPGAKGAACRITKDFYVEVLRFEKTNTGGIRDWVRRRSNSFGYLEAVSARPGQGSVSIFHFGQAYQFAIDLYEFTGIDYEKIPPHRWQYALGLGGLRKSGQSESAHKTERKGWHREKAKEIFSEHKERITLDMADAMLIAYYGFVKQFRGGKFNVNKKDPSSGRGIISISDACDFSI